MILDAVFAANRAVAEAWQSEAECRRKISATDAVADTLDYCAGAILTKLDELQQSANWLGVGDYAALHAVTPQTVRNWIRRGELKAHESGRGFLINRNAKRRREVQR